MFLYVCKQILRKLYGLYNSKILGVKNAKFSWQYFYMNENIQGHFRICISVPLTHWKNAQVFSLNICSQLYHHADPQSVNLSCKSNKLFLYMRGALWDMVQLSWVKTFKRKKGFTLPVPKGQHLEVANV